MQTMTTIIDHRITTRLPQTPMAKTLGFTWGRPGVALTVAA